MKEKMTLTEFVEQDELGISTLLSSLIPPEVMSEGDIFDFSDNELEVPGENEVYLFNLPSTEHKLYLIHSAFKKKSVELISLIKNYFFCETRLSSEDLFELNTKAGLRVVLYSAIGQAFEILFLTRVSVVAYNRLPTEIFKNCTPRIRKNYEVYGIPQ